MGFSLQNITRRLRSLRLTLGLIISLTTLFLLGVLIPQKDLLGQGPYSIWKASKPGLVAVLEFLGFTEIYTAPLTLALWGVFFLNLLMVMSNRIPSTWRRCTARAMPDGPGGVASGRNYIALPGATATEGRAALKRLGYRVFSEGQAFLAIKNRFSPLATVLFHLSFLLLLAGGVTSFYTKFTAKVDLAVGETFSGEYTNYTRAKVGEIPKTSLMLESVVPSYHEGDIPVDLKVTILGRGGRRVVGINRPYTEGPLSFVIVGLDVAPLFVLVDDQGREVDGAFVKMQILKGEMGSFRMAGYEFRVLLYTDMATSGETALAQSPLEISKDPQLQRFKAREIRDPGLRVGAFQQDKLIAEATLRPGEFLAFDSKRLYFRDLRYWINFYVVKEYGLGFVYAGFALMIIALVARLVFYRREVRGIEDGGSLHIAGRSDFYPTLFVDELEAIVKKIVPEAEPRKE